MRSSLERSMVEAMGVEPMSATIQTSSTPCVAFVYTLTIEKGTDYSKRWFSDITCLPNHKTSSGDPI